MRLAVPAVSLVAVLAGACNGNVSPPAPYHSSGNVGGPFVPKDGAGFFDELAGSAHSLEVLMTDYTGACSMGVNSSRINAGALTMSLTGTDPVVASTYRVDNMVTYARLIRWDATCTATTNEPASGGSITLTSVTMTEVKGTFDLVFPDGELKGDFDAPACIPPISDAGTVCVGSDGG